MGLWLSPLTETYQTERNPRLLYNFSWIILNEKVKQYAPKKSISFRQAPHCLLDCILEADPALGVTYIRKVDLTDVHMLI